MHRKTVPMLLMLLLMMTVFPSLSVSAADSKVTTVNILNYGADGTDNTDDTIAVQKALNTALSLSADNKVKVVFPKGRYYVCAPEGQSARSLKIYSNTIVELEEGAEIIRSADTPSTYIFTSSSQHSIIFRGGKINGNVRDGKTARGLMSLRDISGLDINEVDFTSFCGTHAILLDGIQNLNVSACSFSGFRRFTGTLEEYRAQTSATSYWASEALHIDFDFLYGRTMNNVTVSDCTFDGCTSGVGTHHVVEGYVAKNIKITNNVFNNCYYCGCNATAFKDFEFSGNVAAGTPTLLLAQNVTGSIHDNYSDSSALKVSTNTMKNIYQFGINCMELYKMNAISVSNNKDRDTGLIKTMNSTDVEIYNNILYVGSYTGTDSDMNCGIKVYNGAKARIYANTVRGAASSGILSDRSDTEITGNTVYSCNEGISVQGGTDSNVNDNTVINCGSGISLYSTVRASVSGNKVSTSQYSGIVLLECESARLNENTVISCTDGIVLGDTRCETVSGNILSAQTADAISINDGSSVKAVEKNSFFENSGNDISLNTGSEVTLVKGNASDKGSLTTDETGSVSCFIPENVHEHSFMRQSTKSPGCTSAGCSVSVCRDCGLQYCSALYTPIGHRFTASVQQPTYSSQGKTVHTCSICNMNYTDRYKQCITLDDVNGMKALVNSANSVKLSWNKVSGASSYAVYVYNKSLRRWEYYKATNTNTMVVNGLNAGEAYAFTARAVKNTASGKVMSPNFRNFRTSTKPAKVSFTAKSAKAKTVTLNWNKVKGATSYAVFYKTKTSKWVKLATVNNKTTTFTKTGLKEGGAYYFTVRAYRTYEGVTYGGDFTAKGVTVKSTPKTTATKKDSK